MKTWPGSVVTMIGATQAIRTKAKRISFLVFVLLLQSGVASATEYPIYGEDKSGSKFKQKIYVSSLPLNKSYRKLNDEQKAVLHADYPDMPEGDTPPFPKKGLGKILKPYVKKFRWYSNLDGGTFYVSVDDSGEVVSVRSEGIPYNDVVGYVSRLVYRSPFDPATCSGEACAGEFVLRVGKINDPKCFSCL